MGNERSNCDSQKRVKLHILLWRMRIDLRTVYIFLSVPLNVSIDNWKVNLHCRWFSKPIFNYAYLHVIRISIVYGISFPLSLYVQCKYIILCAVAYPFWLFLRSLRKFREFENLRICLSLFHQPITFSCFFCINFNISSISMFIQYNFLHSIIMMLAELMIDIGVVTIIL